MSKAAALALAQALSLSIASNTDLDYFYTEAVYALGALPYIVEASLIALDPLQATFVFPETGLIPLAVFYHDRVLDYMTREQLQSVHPEWLDARGWPLAYTDDDLSERTFRLYPLPTQPSDPYIPLFFDPLGRDYPAYNVLLLHTQFVEDVPVHLELPLIYSCLAREFARESVHMDAAWAERCVRIAALLMRRLQLPGIT